MMHLEMKRRPSALWYVDDADLPFFVGTAAKNCNTANYEETKEKIRRNEKHVLRFETGIFPDKIYFLDQKHEDKVFEARESYAVEALYYAEGDALITDISNHCLVIRTADCVPLFFADKKNHAVAAIHSGWRSTAKNIAEKTFLEMNKKYGTEPSDITAYILPCIGSDYYEVKQDVASIFPEHIIEKEDKLYFDIRAAVVSQLRKIGIGRNSIFADYRDTFGFNESFFSHRKGDLGRNLNFIYLK